MATGNIQNISLNLVMWFLRCMSRQTDRHADHIILQPYQNRRNKQFLTDCAQFY